MARDASWCLFRAPAFALIALVCAAAHAEVARGSAPTARTATWTNTLGMVFVRVPTGSFTMGGIEPPESLARAYPTLEAARFTDLADEGPAHRVTIGQAFYLGQHEVTVGQFRRFVQASGYRAESEADGTGGYGYNPRYDPATTVRGDAFEGRDTRYSWRDPGFAQGDDHPVVNVTWNDAMALADWLSRTEGHHYRLPTEAEWEYACRAGTRTRYPHGDDPQGLLHTANTFDQAAAPLWPRWQQHALAGNDGHAFTAPVGSYGANAFGLHDMLGNAWEWVADWHGDNYYAHSPRNDPRGPAHGTVRVRRGGSWHTWAFYARCGYRNWNSPQTRYTLVGMRLAREISAAP
ncbi:formylglycine-generating enzyme family protein [Acidovorax sp. NO-1]|uniref:formylglycine-generating enzyme family protein n=1 Tax=Acidovorax sp. NO-1 TaxID=512030 RepID=UPI000A2F2E53